MSKEKPSPENTKEQDIHAKDGAALAEPTEEEIGGFKASGLKEPTRYGDWEVKGRCSDF